MKLKVAAEFLCCFEMQTVYRIGNKVEIYTVTLYLVKAILG